MSTITNEPIGEGVAIGTNITTIYSVVAPNVSVTVDVTVVTRDFTTASSLQMALVDASHTGNSIPDNAHLIPKNITFGTNGQVTSGFLTRDRIIVPVGKKIVAIATVANLTAMSCGYARRVNP